MFRVYNNSDFQRKYVRENPGTTNKFHTQFKVWVTDLQATNGGSTPEGLWEEIIAEDKEHPYRDYPLSCVPSLPPASGDLSSDEFGIGLRQDLQGEGGDLYTFPTIDQSALEFTGDLEA